MLSTRCGDDHGCSAPLSRIDATSARDAMTTSVFIGASGSRPETREIAWFLN
jgi:hypothetical protein